MGNFCKLFHLARATVWKVLVVRETTYGADHSAVHNQQPCHIRREEFFITVSLAFGVSFSHSYFATRPVICFDCSAF